MNSRCCLFLCLHLKRKTSWQTFTQLVRNNVPLMDTPTTCCLVPHYRYWKHRGRMNLPLRNLKGPDMRYIIRNWKWRSNQKLLYLGGNNHWTTGERLV